MKCCDYDDVMRRVRIGEIKLAPACYDAKTGNFSSDARKLPGLFPDFNEIFEDSIRRLS